MARRRIRQDERIVADRLFVQRVVLIDIAILLRHRVGVRERRAPVRVFGVRFLGRQQHLRGLRLDAVDADDERAETRNPIAPRLTAIHPERPVGSTIAERPREPVVTQHARHSGARVPHTQTITHAEAELIRVRHLQVVGDRIDLLPRIRAGDQRVQGVEPAHVLRIERDAGR